MKKNTILTAIAFVAAFIIVASNSMVAFAAIPVEDAMIIATGNAGVNQEEVIFTQEETETINGIAQYDISFVNGSTEYQYQINASTGEVLYYNTILH